MLAFFPIRLIPFILTAFQKCLFENGLMKIVTTLNEAKVPGEDVVGEP